MDSSQISNMYPTNHDLPLDTRTQMVSLLNQHMADLTDLHSQVKQAHWNVKGIGFIALHKLFDELAVDLIGFVDTVGERVTALGGDAAGTVRMAAANSRLVEFPADMNEDRQFVEAIAARYADYGTLTRVAIDTSGDINDLVTQDIFIEISRQVDKHLYFLEAHLR